MSVFLALYKTSVNLSFCLSAFPHPPVLFLLQVNFSDDYDCVDQLYIAGIVMSDDLLGHMLQLLTMLSLEKSALCVQNNVDIACVSFRVVLIS